MKLSFVPLLRASQYLSEDTRRALRDDRLDDVARIFMSEYGLNCVEAGDLLNFSACDDRKGVRRPSVA